MNEAAIRQRLTAILAADAAGFSRSMTVDERATVAALDAARTVFRKQIEAHQGRVIDMAGDSVLAVFETATGAVAAALAIQHRLGAACEADPPAHSLRFRIGVHLGDVFEKHDGTVYGDGVNIAARLQALAEPGGITVSDAVRGVVSGRVSATFTDRGEQQLKNIAAPIRAFAVSVGKIAPGSSASLARSGVPNNLPLNLPTLIGRESELQAVGALLATTHLLTLVGAGGVGKTRFALELAATVREGYPDGVWFVELAPVADPALVARIVAGVLGVHEEPGRPLLDTLLDFLRRRALLIVLDNCEHLIEACARFAEQVLHSSAATRTLATSREPLDIDGELAWRLPSLRTAAPGDAPSPEQLMEYPATRVFVQRAAAAAPAFALTPHNAAAVASICHQLDGIPLALELAAARVKAMRVEQVAERLRDRFALLTRGSRTALQRHQTLRSLIDWSHELLPEPERALLRRLAVFAGGWTLEAAEAVCGGAGPARDEVFELLTHLVEKSLVLLDEQSPEPRYRMLETIRQYALEKLGAAGETEAVRMQHLEYFGALAESLRTRLPGSRELHWIAVADLELDNVRAALGCALQPGNAERGLHLINALHRYWYQEMHWKEVLGWVERLGQCSERDGPPSAERARSLYVAGMLVTNFDPPAGRRLCEQCLALSRTLGFHEGMAWSLAWIGYIDTRRRDPATALLFEQSLQAGRLIEDPWRQAMLLTQCLICYAGYEALMGRDESVEDKLHECELQNAKMGGLLYAAHCRALRGTMATRRGDFERARSLLAESLAMYRSIDSKFDIAGSLAQQGFLALRMGEAPRALDLFRESLPLHRNYPSSPWVTKGLAHLLIAYAAAERWQVAARLAGVLGGSEEPGHTAPAAPPELSGQVARSYAEAVARTRTALGEQAFEDECSNGRRMTREQAIEFALAE